MCRDVKSIAIPIATVTLGMIAAAGEMLPPGGRIAMIRSGLERVGTILHPFRGDGGI